MSQKTVGVLGGGQLGRMLAEAANRLNIKVIALDKENAPTKQITAHGDHVAGSFKDPQAIAQLAGKVDVLTIEIEHVDVEQLKEVQSKSGKPVHPDPKTIQIIQDKYDQKTHLINNGIAVARSIPLNENTDAELRRLGDLLGYPFMLKSRKDAYDGRGNFVVKQDNIGGALKALGGNGRGLYSEKWAPFVKELAVMVVRTSETTLAFPTVETVHENSICKLTYTPPRNVSAAVQGAAQQLAKEAVQTFQGKGVYGVEMFLLEDGKLLINEIAPRPHNSGHYTIEGCYMSQFEAHLHAILDLPIPERRLRLREPSIMLNILGGSTPDAHHSVVKAALESDGTVHLYGKGDGSKGRKMGHITITAPTMSEAETQIAPLIHAVDVISGIQKAGDTYPIPRGPLVAVIMGSDSDLPTLKAGLDVLDRLGIPHVERVTSAHRTPDLMRSFSIEAVARGIKVIIAAAGGAAHLPGMSASYTPLPVIGVPVKGSSLDGVDSVYSILQMPRGTPVATIGINNSVNAALLAARILGVADERIQKKVLEFKSANSSESLGKDERLQEVGYEKYLKDMGR
jgi:phosphoribosylaminoimidazole carboxylase